MALNPLDDALETLDEQTPAPSVAPPPKPPATPVDAFGAFLDQQLGDQQRRQETDLRKSTIDGGALSPDRAAEVKRLATRLGVPEAIVARNFDAIVARAKVVDTPYAQMLRETPALAEWMSQAPTNAALGHDDLPALTALEQALKHGATLAAGGATARTSTVLGVGQSLAGALAAGVTEFGAGVLGSLRQGAEMLAGAPGVFAGAGDPFLQAAGAAVRSPLTAPFLAHQAAVLEQVAAKMKGAQTTLGGGFVERAIYGGVESFGQNLPGLALALMGGGTPALLTAMGATTAGQAYTQARDQGVEVGKAALFAGLQGTVEVATEFIPAHRLMKDLGAGATLVQTLAHQIVPEVLTEEVATVFQDLNEWALLPVNKDRTFEDYWNERPSAIAATLISTIVTMGLTMVAGHGTKRLIERLGTVAETSKTKDRSPEAFEQFIASDAHGTAPQTLYQDVATWAEYWQKKGVDPREVATRVTGDPQAYDRAIETGQDLEIPTARYASQLAGTEHNAYFSRELRLEPDAMNGREAEEFAKSGGEATAPAQGPAAEVKARVVAQLEAAGVEASTADAYATLYESAFGSIAERAGLDPLQLFERYGLTIGREGIPSQAAQVPAGATQAPAGGEALPVGPIDAGRGGEAAPKPRGFMSRERRMELLDPERFPATKKGATGTGTPEELDAMDRRFKIGKYAPVGPADVHAAVTDAMGALLDAPAGDILAGGGEAQGQTGGAGTVEPADAGNRLDVPGGAAERVAAPADRGTAPVSRAPRGAARGTDAIPSTWRPKFALLLDDARQLGYTGDDGTLAALFVDALTDAREIARDLTAVDEDARGGLDLLKAISKLGGIGIDAEGETGMRGELENILESLNTNRTTVRRGKNAGKALPRAFTHKAGGVAGAKNIIVRKGGLPLDRVRESIQQEPQWSNRFDDLSEFLTAVDEAVRVETGTMEAPGAAAADVSGILSDALGVRPGVAWWSEGPAATTEIERTDDAAPEVTNLLTDEGILDSELLDVDDSAVTFNIDEFNQRGLFDDPEVPVDILATGEKQPRLPGDVGAVRDQEVAQPQLGEVADEFRLTAPEETQATQTTLFQPAFHGSEHIFDRFSLHAIGSGEGFQAYGWGLYFASKREVADMYRHRLAGKPKPQRLLWRGEWAVPPYGERGGLQGQLSKAAGIALQEIELRAGDRDAGPGAIKGIRVELVDAIAAQRARQAEPGRSAGTVQADEYRIEMFEQAIRLIDQWGDEMAVAPAERPGRTYTVEIPNDGDYLDWDKAASEQSPKVQAALKALGVKWDPIEIPTPAEAVQMFKAPSEGGNPRLYWTQTREPERRAAYAEGRRLASLALNPIDPALAQFQVDEWQRWYVENQKWVREDANDPIGRDVYSELWSQFQTHEGEQIDSATGRKYLVQVAKGAAERQASEALAAQGVAGIRYLDGLSRQHGTGSSNYVVFDDKLVEIVEFDQPAKPLTDDDVQAWATELKQQTGPDLAFLDVHLTTWGDLVLETLGVTRGAARAGLGTKVMEALTAFADQHQKRITLSPAEKGYQPVEQLGDEPATEATTSYARLVRFYRRFGFVRNAGRYADNSVSKGLYRNPTLRAGKAGLEFGQAVRGTGTVDPPEGKDPRRGSIRFKRGASGQPLEVNISLFERADLSTFLHESAHFYLEVFRDVTNAIAVAGPGGRTDAQQQLLADMDDLQEWLQDDDHTGVGFSEKQHEQFARGFEAYLMSGDAPSVPLRSAFARFRAWLLGLYRSLKALRVNLTPQVTRVFDRIVATERAIFDAEQQGVVAPMFLTAEAAGMTPAEFGLYTSAVQDASRTARERLEVKVLAEVQREQEAQWTARRSEIEAVVTADVHKRPVYQAIAAMQRGTTPAGEPMLEGLEPEPLKLSKTILVQRFGADRLKRLPKPYVYSVDGGVDPDIVADMFDFSSGDELLTAVENAAPMARVIQHETEQRMLAEHGSILLDGTLHEKARAAVANEDRERVVRAELRALGQIQRLVKPFVQAGREAVARSEQERAYERRWLDAEKKLEVAVAKKGRKDEIDALRAEVRNYRRQARSGAATIRRALPPDSAVRAAAETTVARTRVRDLKPERYWSASRKAAQLAIEAAARQDFDHAIALKQQELLNLALYREASNAKEEVEARVRRVRDLSSGPARRRLGLAGESYLDQVDGILDRFNFAKATQKALDRRANLAKWMAEQEAEGLPIDLPASLLDEARRVPFQELTVETFMGVTDGLDHILHLAQLKNRLLKALDRREFEGARDELVASIVEHNRKKNPKLEYTAKDERTRAVADWFASHSKLSFLVRAMDGYQDGGAMWEAIMRPLNAADDAQQARRQQVGKEFGLDVLERHYPGKDLARLSEKLHIPAIGGSLTLEARLAVALNWGNLGNRSRLANDPVRKWTPQQIQAVLDTLGKRDWDFVQATWDYIDRFWPEIEAKMKRVQGVAAEKVEAAEVVTPFGTYRGGYYPIAYDGRLVARAGQNQEAGDIKLAMQAAYVRTTTKRGHEEARVNFVKLSVRLDLSVAFSHLDQVIHDLTHHEALIDVTRLLRDRKVSAAILATQGDVVYQQFTRALQDIALGYVPKRNILDSAAAFMRTGTQISLLGWNLWTAAQQPLGLFNGMNRVGVTYVARGLGRWLRDAATMTNTATWINDVSPFMRGRAVNATQDLSDLRTALRVPGGWFDTLVRTVSLNTLTQAHILDSFLWHIGLAQRVADVPTWLGAYEKAMEGDAGDEARAFALADQAVIDSQGHGSIKDLAQVQRGGHVSRMFMTFYSYGNLVFNQTKEAVGRTSFKSPAQIVNMLGSLSLIYLLPALATTLLAHAIGKKQDDDDPDALLAEIGRELLSTALNTMVLVRELGGLVTSGGARGYEGPAGARAIAMGYHLGEQVKQGEPDEALLKALNNLAGQLFRYPAMQVQRTADGAAALAEGRSTNPGVLIGGPPPKGQ